MRTNCGDVSSLILTALDRHIRQSVGGKLGARKRQGRQILHVTYLGVAIVFAHCEPSLATMPPVGCEAWSRSILESYQQRKGKTIPVEIEAATYLQALSERIWFSVYYGKPTAALTTARGAPFCGDLHFLMARSDGTKAHVESEAEIPRSSNGMATDVWPYSCSPTKVTLEGIDRNTQVTYLIEVVEAENAEKLFVLLAEAIQSDEFAWRYCLSSDEAKHTLHRLLTLFNGNNKEHLGSANLYGLLHGYYILEHPETAFRRFRIVDFLRSAELDRRAPQSVKSRRILSAQYSVSVTGNLLQLK